MIPLKIRQVYENDNVVRYILIILSCHLIIGFSSNQWILTEEMYYNYFGGQVESSNIEKVIDKTRNFNIVKAIWSPFSHLFTTLGTTFCLNLGCLYYNRKLKFSQLLNVSLISSLFFLIPPIIKFFYFVTIPSPSLSEYNQYNFGSLIFLTSQYDPFWLRSLLDVFTLFELLYWIALSFGLKILLILEFNESLKLVLSSYLTGLILWVSSKIFIQLLVFNMG